MVRHRAIARSSDAQGRSARASWAAYQRCGAPQTRLKPSLSNRPRTASNRARDSAASSASASGSARLTWSRPSCQWAGVSRPQARSKTSTPSPCAAWAANGNRPSAPRQPRAAPSARSCGGDSVVAPPLSRWVGARRDNSCVKFGRERSRSTCDEASEASEANGISRCMRVNYPGPPGRAWPMQIAALRSQSVSPPTPVDRPASILNSRP